MQSGFTPAVRRDGFLYDDGHGFWAAGDNYRGARMSTSDLRVALTANYARGQGPSVELYAAQLVHYGMKPMKTKDAIKKKLLAKLNEGSLKVPDSLLVLEQQLKQEWEAADDARKVQAAMQVPPAAGRTLVQRRKQTARKSTGRKLISVSASRASPITVASTSPEAEDQPIRTKQTARMSKWPGHRAMFEDAAQRGLRTVKHSKEQIREKVGKLSKSDAHGLIMHLLETVPAVGKPLDKALFSREKVGGKKIGERLSRQDWAGLYYVTTRGLFDEWDYDGPMELEVCPSSTSSHVWVSFDFGMISGVMRSIRRPPGMAGEKVPFEWRGRTGLDERQMSFEKDNYGYLRFFGNGLLEANMRGFGPKLRFSAAMPSISPATSDQGGAGTGKKSAREAMVKEWKREWRSINRNNYQIENSRRWGNARWGGRETVDEPYASDTSDGKGMRDGPLPSFDALSSGSEPDSGEDGLSDDGMDIDYAL